MYDCISVIPFVSLLLKGSTDPSVAILNPCLLGWYLRHGLADHRVGRDAKINMHAIIAEKFFFFFGFRPLYPRTGTSRAHKGLGGVSYQHVNDAFRLSQGINIDFDMSADVQIPHTSVQDSCSSRYC